MEFTSLGTVVATPTGGKKIAPVSMRYHAQMMNRFPVGAKIQAKYKETKRKHTRSQHGYYFVLANLLADHTGFTESEMHDVLMKICFGIRTKVFRGVTFQVRESMSNARSLTVPEVQELLDYTLKVCSDEGVVVPSKEELGYLPS